MRAPAPSTADPTPTSRSSWTGPTWSAPGPTAGGGTGPGPRSACTTTWLSWLSAAPARAPPGPPPADLAASQPGATPSRPESRAEHRAEPQAGPPEPESDRLVPVTVLLVLEGGGRAGGPRLAER